MPDDTYRLVVPLPIALPESNARSNEVDTLIETLEGLDLGIAVFDAQRRLTRWNRAYLDLHPLTAEAVRAGVLFEDLVRAEAEQAGWGPVEIEALIADRLARLAERDQERYEDRFASGRVLEIRCFPLSSGGFVSTCSDVTERRAARETLRESTRRFRDFAVSASEWLWEMGPDLRFTFMSNKLTSSSGFSLKRVVGLTRLEAAGIEPQASLDENWRRHLNDLEARRPFRDFRYWIHADDGSEACISTSGVPVFGPEGEFRGYRGTGINLTPQVEAERQAREAQARLDAAIESIADGFALFDADDRLVLCNENYRKAIAPVADLLAPDVTWVTLFTTLVERGGVLVPAGEDKRSWVEAQVREHRGNASVRAYRTGDGRFIEVREYPTADGGRVLIRTDVTDRERAQAALRDSENRFRDFASASSDWFWEMGADLRFTWLSHHFEERTKIPADSVVGHAREEFAGPDAHKAEWQRHLADLTAHRPFRDFRYAAFGVDGARRHFSVSGLPIFDDNGAFQGYRGTSTEITAQIEAEQNAATARERLVDAVENISEGFVLWDQDDRLVLCNAKFKEFFAGAAAVMAPGVSFEAVLRHCAGSGTHGPLDAGVDAWLKARMALHRTPGEPFEQCLSNGSVILVHERRTSEGGIASIYIDITDMKAREAALRASQESLANAQRIAHVGNWDLNASTNEFTWSDEIFRILGHPPQAFEPRYEDFLDACHPDDRAMVQQAIDAALYRKSAYEIEHRIIRPDGTVRWVEQNGEVLFREDGMPARMTGTVQDTTQRKQAELAVEKAEKRFRLAFETGPDAMMISRLDDGLLIDVNQGFSEITGFSRDQAVGIKSIDLGFWANADDRERFLESLRRDGVLHNAEFTFRSADGAPRTGLVSARIFELDGERLLLSVVRDIDALKRTEQELRKLSRAVEESAASVLITDKDGVIEYVNRRFTEVTGYSRDEAVGRTPSLLKSGELTPEDYRELWSHILSGRLWHGEFCNRRKDGRLYWASALISPIRMPDGAITHFVGIQEDISDRKRSEDALRASEERFRGLVEGSVLGIVIDREGRPLFANATYAKMFGFERPEDILILPSLDALYHPQDVGLVRRYRAARFAGLAAPEEYEFRGLRQDGTVVWIRAHVKLVSWNRQPAVQSTVVDITKQKEYEEQLHRQANYDTITDLPNRTLALDRLEKAVAHARRHGSGLGVLFIDVDHFKHINDTLGHALGDRFLREVARRIQGCLRQEDTVARLGGDEFTVILSDLRDGRDAEAVANKILETFTRRFLLDGQEAFSSASIGVALWPTDGDDPETMMRNADAAMYQAKERGRNTVHFFTQELNARALERVRMENHLRRGLQGEEFQLAFQPLVEVESGRVVGAETLLRWNSPTLGRVTPDRFIRLAENTGLIVPIGQWVLDTACRQVATWRAEGVCPLSLSVNISSRQFRGPALVDAVAQALESSGIPPAFLELEITESTLMDDLPQTQMMIDELKKLGVRLAVDDFGTGYSSLSYLSRFPLDTLKIDKSFIRDAPFDEVNAALVEAMIAMAHALGMRTVAEGVERREQLDFLRSRGCDVAQGYFFSAPVPHESLAACLRDPETGRQSTQWAPSKASG